MWASHVALVVRNLAANAWDVRDVALIPGLERSPGGGYGNTPQYSCLENPMDRGAWRATLHRVAKSGTQLKQLSTYYFNWQNNVECFSPTKKFKILKSVCMHAKLLQLCPTLFDPMDCSLPGSFIHGILQARILEWVAIPTSRGSFWPRDWSHVSYVSCIGRRVLYH